MPIPAFARMADSLLAAIGEDSTLTGGPDSTIGVDLPCRVNVEHGVQMTGAIPRSGVNYVGYDDDMVVEKSVATFLKSVGAAAGDTLVHPDGTFVLDAILSDTGYTRRFILRDA